MDDPGKDCMIEAASTRPGHWDWLRWPGLVRDIATIVIGVLLALAANEAAEEWKARERITEAEERIRQEYARVFAFQAEQVSAAPCVDAQLTRLAARVMGSSDTLTPAPLHARSDSSYVAILPTRPYGLDVWDALVADGTAANLPLAITQETLRGLTRENWMALGRLAVLASPLPLDPAT